MSFFESSSPSRKLARQAAAVENHGRRDHRSGERPAPGLVDAADEAGAAPLEREIRHARRHRDGASDREAQRRVRVAEIDRDLGQSIGEFSYHKASPGAASEKVRARGMARPPVCKRAPAGRTLARKPVMALP